MNTALAQCSMKMLSMSAMTASDALRKDPACVPCRRNLRALLWPSLERPPSTVPRRDDAGASGRRYLDALHRERVP